MQTVQATFLLSIVCFLGCTSTHRLRQAHEADYVSINKRVQDNAVVTFTDGRKVQVENLHMTSDSTYWISTNRIATAQIKEVRSWSAGGTRSIWSLDKSPNQTELYNKINVATAGRHAVLVLKDGQATQVRQLWVTSDITYWIDPAIKLIADPTFIGVATQQIRDVHFKRRGKGAWQGAGFGLLLGAIVGSAAGRDCTEDEFVCFSRGEVAVAFGFLGALLGAPLGAIIANDEVYQIEHEKDTGTN